MCGMIAFMQIGEFELIGPECWDTGAELCERTGGDGGGGGAG